MGVKMLLGRSERGRFVKASIMFSVAKAECELGRVWFGLKITYEVIKENLHIRTYCIFKYALHLCMYTGLFNT